jgi:hypothetical protein
MRSLTFGSTLSTASLEEYGPINNFLIPDDVDKIVYLKPLFLITDKNWPLGLLENEPT